MQIFYRPFTDPYLNIAAEEYFVKYSCDDMCMIWINQRSVIIGKHQNAFAEINYPYVRNNHIPVIRRISGGGAVYHDTGNVNFTFIQKTTKTDAVDFHRFTSIINNFMQSFGIAVNVNQRNSLLVGNLKFSGHAEHVFHDKILHHGTILFNTDLEALQQSLNAGNNYQGKALASVKSDVLNIAPLLPEKIDIHQFIKIFCNWLLDYFPGSVDYHLQPDEIAAINMLSETKYKTWQWNFGYSPAYSFEFNIPTIETVLPVKIKVVNGIIEQVDFLSDTSNNKLSGILPGMIGISHREEEIDKFVENNLHTLELAGINTVYFKESFFK